MTTFGEKLRELRRTASLSQEELAERAGLTAAAVGALERGERRHPYPHTVAALATALGLSDPDRRALAGLVPVRPRAGAVSPDEGWPATAPPSPMAPIVGRRRELDALRGLLSRPGVRLVTLTGPGGVGKTRVATEAARGLGETFTDGVAWVDLGGVREAGAVFAAVARGFGLPEASSLPVEHAVQAYLRRRRVLVVLDGFEHLLEATSDILDLLRACPGVTILVTSREALHVSGEHEFQVRPLGLPAPDTASVRAVGSADAVKLLVQRARAVVPDFRLTAANTGPIVEICTRLDGLPLALELAAVQLKYFSPADLARALATGAVFEGRARAIPARQRSLQATLDWSHGLLGPGERVLFRRLAVFRGGFSVESAAAVCADEHIPEAAVPALLAALVDKSLLFQRTAGDGRLGMLLTVQQYAAARLAESPDEDSTRGRHALHMAELAEAEENALHGAGREQAIWRLGLDDDNFRAALEWSVASAPARCAGVRLAGALGWYWIFRGALTEMRHWTRTLLSEEPPCQTEHLAALFYTAAASSWKDGDIDRAAAYADQAIERSRGADERRLAFAISLRGLVAVSSGRGPEAVALHRESLACFRSLGDPWGQAYASANLGDALFVSGNPGAAAECYDRALTEFAREKDAWGQAIVLHTLGNIAFSDGDFRMAAERYEASIAFDRQAGNRIELARSEVALSAAALHLGDIETAATALEDSLSTWEDYANADGRALCFLGMAAVARIRGEPAASALLQQAAREAAAHPAVYAVDPGIFAPFLADEAGW